MDGATSTALGLLAFSSMGIEYIDHLIPKCLIWAMV